MKTRIKKIIVMAMALLFVSVGVSFAAGGNKGNSKKVPKNAYGQYNKGPDDHHPGWNKKDPEPSHDFRDRHRHRMVNKVRHQYPPKYWHALKEKAIIRFKASEPDYKIVVVLKDR